MSLRDSHLVRAIYRYVRPCPPLGYDTQGRAVYQSEPGPLPPRHTPEASLATIVGRLR